MRNRILVIILLFALSTLASAQNFAAPRVFTFGNAGAQQIALGDFNGDGLPDIVASYNFPAARSPSFSAMATARSKLLW